MDNVKQRVVVVEKAATEGLTAATIQSLAKELVFTDAYSEWTQTMCHYLLSFIMVKIEK